MTHEAGGHRIQRRPRTDPRGRVQSSTVTVTVMTASAAAETPASRRASSDFSVAWYSGTGAGGQHRNRHLNSARITHLPTGIVRSAQTRSRANSMADAMATLTSELDRLAAQAGADAANALRRGQVGTGERSDRRRTWAFQRDVVEDFETGRRTRCGDALRGGVDRLWPTS